MFEHIGRVAVPAVGGDDHHRAAQRVAVRRGQQVADASAQVRAAVAVDDLRVGPRQRHLGRAVGQHRREPGQRCREREHLRANPRLPQRRGTHQMQVDRRVGLHRPADVTGQHDPPGPKASAGAGQHHRFPAGRAGGVHRRPQVDGLAVPARLPAQAAPTGPAAHRVLQPRADQPQVVGIEPVERFVGARDDAAGQHVGHRDAGYLSVDGGHR